jgi:cyclin-dependent kinase 12/13
VVEELAVDWGLVAMAGKAWGSRSVEIFEKVEQVGEGTYGQVYKARNKESGEVVALKRVRMDNEKEGFPITAIREIKILKILNHKNVVRLKEIVTSKGSDYNQGKGSIYMVMEFLEHDLTGLTDAGQKFTVPQIKCYMKQLLEGLAYCHAQKVLHRDIKGSNLLISNDGQLKLADFGLARPFDTDQQRPYTNRVITLWYRPPELLLGATMYGPAIDMWSAGCIFAELLLRKPILPGKNEFEQIDLIFKLLGTPDEAAWPKCSKLQYYDMILSQNGHRKYQSRFDEKFGQLDPLAKDLLRKLLMMDPDKRITADDALDHEYFWSDPAPATPDQLPKYPPSHEFTAKKRRQQSQAAQQQQQPLQTQLHHSSQMPPGAQHLPFQQQQHPSSYPPPAYNGNNPHHASNPFYAAARGGSGAGGGGNPSQGGPPHAKRFREGQPPGGHSSGFFDQAQHQQQPNGGPRHHPTGGYPGGGWPGNR